MKLILQFNMSLLSAGGVASPKASAEGARETSGAAAMVSRARKNASLRLGCRDDADIFAVQGAREMAGGLAALPRFRLKFYEFSVPCCLVPVKETVVLLCLWRRREG